MKTLLLCLLLCTTARALTPQEISNNLAVQNLKWEQGRYAGPGIAPPITAPTDEWVKAQLEKTHREVEKLFHRGKRLQWD